jgi:BirA family biotin operon repressor/biotin-[acetyl-CoA-carboxylase] ligase
MAPPASLSATLGRPVPRLGLLRSLLARADAHYAALCQGWSPHEAWRGHLVTIGQVVEAGTPEEVVSGVAEDVDADGALLVRTAGGALRRILAGDVTLRGYRLA